MLNSLMSSMNVLLYQMLLEQATLSSCSFIQKLQSCVIIITNTHTLSLSLSLYAYHTYIHISYSHKHPIDLYS